MYLCYTEGKGSFSKKYSYYYTKLTFAKSTYVTLDWIEELEKGTYVILREKEAFQKKYSYYETKLTFAKSTNVTLD
jgi:hypothetical protein